MEDTVGTSVETINVSNPPDNVENIRAEIEAKLKKQYDIDLAKRVDEIRQQTEEEIRRAIVRLREDEKAEKKPLEPAQIEQLLEQEYVEFKVKVHDQEREITHAFVIREVPQDAEIKFYKLVQKTLLDSIQELEGVSFKLADGDILTKLQYMMNIFEPMFDVMADAAVIALNHDGRYAWLDRKWVQSHLTSKRILAISMAQAEVNKLRDFFLLLSQEYQSTTKKSLVDALS